MGLRHADRRALHEDCVKDRVGQVWEMNFVHSPAYHEDSLHVVVGVAERKGVDHHNPHSVLWIHPCVNLATGERFDVREWSDTSWENSPTKTRIA